jgi:hypothetical protein
MDQMMMKNPSGGHLRTILDTEAPPFSDDDNLWNTFDITVGLDESFVQPAYKMPCNIWKTSLID